METVLRVTGLNKSFGPIRALTDVSLSIRRGEVVALVGDNGAGKSTINKVLSGAIRPDSGDLHIKGRKINLSRYSVRKARSLGIETVYQERSLAEKQPLWRNVFVGRHITNRLGFISVQKEKKITLSMLQRSIGLTGVGISADALVGTLSGGERQGLAISRAMHFDSDLMILDEPTTALSVKEVQLVLKFVRSIAEKGKSAIFVSHNMYHVHEVADRFVFVDRGSVVDECCCSTMTVTQLLNRLTELSLPSSNSPSD